MKASFANGRGLNVRRAGSAAVEVVMATAVMLPVAGALFLLGIKICTTLYQAIGALVAWPFL